MSERITMMTSWVKAWVAGNKAAQAMPEDKGLYNLADEAGYARDTLEWEAFVAGGCAFLFKGADLSAYA